MNIEELPEREYIINWFGIGSDLVHMLKAGLSPIQCMKRLRQTRLRERIIRCKDCREYNPELYRHISCELLECYVEPNGFCAWEKQRDV